MRPSNIVLTIPTKEEKSQAARFRTYVNYLSSLRAYLKTEYSSPETLVAKITTTTIFNRIQGGKCLNQETLKQMLWNSWFTELQMHISAPPKELLPYSNHWAPVQLYYTLYLATRAYFISSGNTVPPNHTATLSTITNEIKNRPLLFPYPWKIQCEGDPANDTVTYTNLPPDVQVQQISSLSPGEHVDFYDSYCMFLRTTRKRQIENRIEQWKHDNNRKRIKGAERRILVNNLSPSSLFDAIYRLRARSNYQDADSVLLTLDLPDSAKIYNYGLRSISWYSLLVLETLIARYLGRKNYEQIVNRFAGYDLGKASQYLVQRRWNIIEDGLRQVSA